MVCQLCREEKTLLKKSHIIPNFMYKGLYGQTHKLVEIDLASMKKVRTTFSGYYEKGILCARCDNELLSKYETYASAALYNQGKTSVGTNVTKDLMSGNDGLQYYSYTNLDYTKLKLFFLSILWRAHIAKQPFFSEVDLGRYAEKIRLMLLAGDPGKEDELETSLIQFEDDGSRPYGTLIEFRKLTDNNNTYYVFHMDSLMYNFNISPQNKESIFLKGLLRNNGTMDIAYISGQFGRGFFDSFVGKQIYMKNNVQR